MRIEHIRAAVHGLLLGLPVWAFVFAIWLPLAILGVPVCAALAWFSGWRMQESQRYPAKHAAIAGWKYLDAIYGNEEDGVTGDQRWWPAYCKAKGWNTPQLQAFMWSAIRNPVNNFRFLKLVDIGNDRLKRIRYVGNSQDCQLDLNAYRTGTIKHATFWFYCWTGPYPAFWLIHSRDDGTHMRLRFGWKFTPVFVNGIPAGDYREASESWTPVQFGWRRQG